MRRLKFNHDIGHCNQDKCDKAQECRRYLAHLEAQENDLDYLSYLIIDDPETCDVFWPTNTYYHEEA
jgi:hypothetical protein